VPLVDADILTHATTKAYHGYRWQIHAGPAVASSEIARTGASAQSLQAIAVTMIPAEPGHSGVRSFCADTSGHVCFVIEGLLRVQDGRCLECQPLQ
jgi:hypothetical protein